MNTNLIIANYPTLLEGQRTLDGLIWRNGKYRKPPNPAGSSIRVEPIRLPSDIERIKSLLKNKPRDLTLFVLGINTNLRAGDMCRLTVDHIRNIGSGDSFLIKEQKTGKNRRITLNAVCHAQLKHYLDWLKPGKNNDYLFRSQKVGRLGVSTVNRMVKKWCKEAGLKGNYGSHSLRKTWGYHAWKKGFDIPRLMSIFNHSTQAQTLQYLCIQDTDIKEVYMEVSL